MNPLSRLLATMRAREALAEAYERYYQAKQTRRSARLEWAAVVKAHCELTRLKR
jgi:hypothetical protein